MKPFMHALVASTFVLAGGPAAQAATETSPVSFGSLEAVGAAAARTQAEAWLKQIGRADAQTLAKVAELWKDDQRPVLDRLADTFALGSVDAAQLLAEARNASAPAPTKIPDLLKDAQQPVFFRANLGLAYARALSQRKIHEEALAALKIFQPEQVVDPAAYLFHRTVSEHALLLKPEALRSIDRLLDDAQGAPERYKTLSTLMLLDMMTWKDKDLGTIARKMENIERRLELARGGPETQKMQRDVVSRLDELIKELENVAKKQVGNGGACPGGGNQPGQAGGPNPTAPLQDSVIASNGGPGRVDPAKLRKVIESWGSLPPREQARALQELTQGMSSSHREAIENYFRNLAQGARE